jgi:hypothetical protein
MEWINCFFPSCCNLQWDLVEQEPHQNEVIEVVAMETTPKHVNETIHSFRNHESFIYKPNYLYNDPEMEIWFQKHCRTWGFKELYI